MKLCKVQVTEELDFQSVVWTLSQVDIKILFYMFDGNHLFVIFTHDAIRSKVPFRGR